MKKAFTVMAFVSLFLLVGGTLSAGWLYDPMTSDLDGNQYDIFDIDDFLSDTVDTGALTVTTVDVGDIVVDDLVTKFPRVDVRYFGAVGDGSNDDTAEIQDAIDFAQTLAKAWQPSGGVYLGSVPEVYFPSGRYKVSDTLTLACYTTASGADGRAIIEMTGDNADTTNVFDFSYCLTNRVENFVFVGGQSQIRLANPNLDTTTFRIENCEFHLAKDYAILSEYTAPGDHLSALITIDKCKFYGNNKVAKNWADCMILQDCWISAGGTNMADAAAIWGRGCVYMIDTTAIADAGSGQERNTSARWVDTYGTFYASRTSFGGANDGIPIVYNYGGVATGYPYLGGGKVSITGCRITCGGTNTNASVIKLYDVPQQVVLRDNNYLVDSPYILCDGSVDLDTHFDSISSLDAKYDYVIEPNLAWPGTNAVPEQLRAFVDPLCELYRGEPTTGHWKRGHVLLNSAPGASSHVGIVNTSAGEPGTWSYFGKTSPFPIGRQDATQIAGDKGKYTLELPASTNVTVLITIASNPDESSSSAYYTSLTIILSVESGWNGSAATDYIKYDTFFAPTLASTDAPTIDTIHFGNGDTGDAFRAEASGGEITVVWDNCTDNEGIAIETLCVR